MAETRGDYLLSLRYNVGTRNAFTNSGGTEVRCSHFPFNRLYDQSCTCTCFCLTFVYVGGRYVHVSLVICF